MAAPFAPAVACPRFRSSGPAAAAGVAGLLRDDDRRAILNEGLRAEPIRLCPDCGREGAALYRGLRDRLSGTPGLWSFLRCPACGLVWLDPRPSPDEMGRIYSSYFTHIAPPARALDFLRRREAMKAALLAAACDYRGLSSGRGPARLAGILASIPQVRDQAGSWVLWLRGGERGRLLDVGCGNGAFLVRMRDLGWDVTGVEPDPRAARIAAGALPGRVFEGPLEEAGFPDGAFDALTLSHVIEHVPDPVGLLREGLRVVRPGGRLALLTPNLESLGHRILGEAWEGLDPPRHVFLFTRETLRACAERAGWRVDTVRATARSARSVWASSRRSGRPGGPGPSPAGPAWKRLRWEGMIFQAVESASGLAARRGEELRLEARK